ncbi:hypothetical protein [Bacteroides sedimenti]|uniref:Uncharacterized protein n=1 Tax=Bacteroides sedimenti TaxID=2136147 RepID=A0ABM8IBX3_9BACE
MDDFLHLLYLKLHNSREGEITRINADTYKQSFKSLKDLTDSNYEHFEGMYPFYLTTEQLEELKDTFKSKEENKGYFKNIDTFKFLPFKRLSDMAKCFYHSRSVDIFRDRAYYLWKEFSSFVHYSNYTFEYEIKNAPENLYIINEAFQYCYNSIYLSFKYFERTFGLTFKDDKTLNNMYGIILSC